MDSQNENTAAETWRRRGDILKRAKLGPQVFFLHLPKCAGTTVHQLLKDWYGQAQLHPERHNNLYEAKAVEIAARHVFSGHFDVYSLGFLPRPALAFTFLREPHARLVSLYNFLRAHRELHAEKHGLTLMRYAQKLDLKDFLRHPRVRQHPSVNNTYARMLSDEPQLTSRWEGHGIVTQTPIRELAEQALRNLEAFSFVGVFELLEQSVSLLAEHLGKSPPETLPRLQAVETLMDTNSSLRRIPLQRADAETIAICEELVAEDRRLYLKAQQLLFQRHAKLPGHDNVPRHISDGDSTANQAERRTAGLRRKAG